MVVDLVKGLGRSMNHTPWSVVVRPLVPPVIVKLIVITPVTE
jgi:hypothetical protein